MQWDYEIIFRAQAQRNGSYYRLRIQKGREGCRWLVSSGTFRKILPALNFDKWSRSILEAKLDAEQWLDRYSSLKKNVPTPRLWWRREDDFNFWTVSGTDRITIGYTNDRSKWMWCYAPSNHEDREHIQNASDLDVAKEQAATYVQELLIRKIMTERECPNMPPPPEVDFFL